MSYGVGGQRKDAAQLTWLLPIIQQKKANLPQLL